MTRHLDWEGVFNYRDFGGIVAQDGRTIRRGALVRGDSADDLTTRGWEQLVVHGVRTVVDLRNADEYATDAVPSPPSVTRIRLPLDGTHDREFWDIWQTGPEFGTPLYYEPHLARFPERSAAVVSAIARAEPGGVLFHCTGGRDRAGQISMLLLAILGVPPEVIAADYAHSFERLPARYRIHQREDHSAVIAACLADRGTTAEREIVRIVSSLDIEHTLRRGGVTDADLAALRARLFS